ncbi:MAG: glycosyltransferase [Bacteroidales bacterium]
MPRILRILNRFNLGGPTYNAAYLTRYMDDEFETLLVGGPNDPSEKNSEYIVQQLGIDPLIIPEMKREISPSNDYKAFQKIKQLIRSYQPDIVHTHASKAGALGRHAALVMKVPHIFHTFHGHVFDAYFHPLKTRFYKNVERRLGRKTTGIIALSEKQKYDLTQKYKICKSDKVHVVPLGFDLSRFREKMDEKRIRFRQRFQLSDDEIAIGIIGRLVPIKNHRLFLEAFRILQQKTNKKVRAFIIGDGESRELIKQNAIDLGINWVNGSGDYQPASLTFTSWIKEIDFAFAGLDIIALTSHNEGTPVSLIEAQAAGKPIVSTRVGGIEDVVIPGITALLSESGDKAAFAENLQKLAENDKIRRSFSESGWQKIGQKFHYSRLVEDMEDLYRTHLQNSNYPGILTSKTYAVS